MMKSVLALATVAAACDMSCDRCDYLILEGAQVYLDCMTDFCDCDDESAKAMMNFTSRITLRQVLRASVP